MKLIIRLALLAMAAPAIAQSAPKLTLAQETALRCSAAFALVATEQARKAPGSERYPVLGTRGREYFVRSTARLMDEAHLSRDQVTSLFRVRYDALQANVRKSADPVAALSGTTKACMPLLNAEVPPR